MAFTICFEGVDGSGKTTQIEMLFSKLLKMSRSASIRSYPVYESFFGKELGELLSGTNRQFTASDLDPKSMALWYALDRWLDYQENIRLFKNEGFLLLNRYTLSSMVYQSLRNDNPEIMKWVDRLEHEILGLPRPDLYILFDIIPEISSTNILSKVERPYIGDGKADVYEDDIELQQKARFLYLGLAKIDKKIQVINCYEQGKMLSQQMIHEKVLSVLDYIGLLR